MKDIRGLSQGSNIELSCGPDSPTRITRDEIRRLLATQMPGSLCGQSKEIRFQGTKTMMTRTRSKRRTERNSESTAVRSAGKIAFVLQDYWNSGDGL